MTWLERCHAIYRRLLGKPVADLFLVDLIGHTRNFGAVTWLGEPIWQNVFDIWVTQEVISEVRPTLIIECGTNRGGSAIFFAHLVDLLGIEGRIVSIDVEKMHDRKHDRVDFLIGSSTSPYISNIVHGYRSGTDGPVIVILDSDHSQQHVAAELAVYAKFVTPRSYLLVQDGVIDRLPIFRHGRPGPLPATREFLAQHPEFEWDRERNEKFLITHHPMGWLKRR
jgi:cephalosporin hydroxylase